MKLLILVAALFGSAASASAGLLSYNGFAEGLSDGESLVGKPISAPGYVGSYRNPDTGSKTVPVFQSEGLVFGDKFFQVQGGALILPGSSSIQAVLDHGLSGDIWHSFLFKIPTLPSNLSSHCGTSLRAAGLPNHLFSSAKAQNTGTQLTNSARPGVGYFDIPGRMGGSTANGVSEPVSDPLVEGEVYLAIAHFSRVGETLSAESPGIARIWVFDQSAFEAWRGSGKPTESALDNYALWKGQYERSVEPSQPGSGTADMINYSSYLVDAFTIDEVRIGTTLDSVAVP